MKRPFILMFLIVFFVPATIFAAELKNERARQEGNRLVISYDLEGKEREADVNLTITVEGKTYKSSDLHVEGDVGKVRTGRGKRISWNILQDFPRGFRGAVDWELTTGGDAFTDVTTGMSFVFVKGGCYQMGDTFGGGDGDEKPVHEVCVDDFYMAKHETTVEQFRRFVHDTGYRTEAEKGDGCFVWTGSKWDKSHDANWRSPGFKQTQDHPVACVSWNDATAFVRWLSSKSGKNYRLPTEAEWEYAARSGGKREKWSGTSDGSSLGDYAWYDANSGGQTHPVGQKRPNGLGLHDMSGNVWEWCQDWYGSDYYSSSGRDNPGGPSSGSDRVVRGGGWSSFAAYSRAALRNRRVPDNRYINLGFRLALPPGQ
ncbi:MAG TPA: formylglycine-generating enzyme family protein [Smithellaceae bacterium]|nr:formylglycine-generating enzyme family protein [Smithellaceae bacterium]